MSNFDLDLIFSRLLTHADVLQLYFDQLLFIDEKAFLGSPLTLSVLLQGSSAFVLPVSECVFPGGEFNLCLVGARSSGALRITQVDETNAPTLLHLLQ